jgi:hypothetical protein|tara:strand:- start:436 stop:609 length:174 start_codon:yes stop_codon:yes gene_type:complete
LNKLLELDGTVTHHILMDLVSGMLLKDVDSETADIILTSIWEDPQEYEQNGVIIGYA